MLLAIWVEKGSNFESGKEKAFEKQFFLNFSPCNLKVPPQSSILH